MSARRQLQSSLVMSPDFEKVIQENSAKEVSEEELQEQRVSFAFGNAPASDLITKDSVRLTSQRIRLKE